MYMYIDTCVWCNYLLINDPSITISSITYISDRGEERKESLESEGERERASETKKRRKSGRLCNYFKV